MKFFHISDLHLGKRFNEYSLIDDQKYILNEIIKYIDSEQPDAILIAGDIYDKTTPSVQAVELFDYFICELARRKVQVFIISGNHDSAERLSFANRLLSASGIHISNCYNGEISPTTLGDEYGELNVYLLPFIKPVNVRNKFLDATVENYSDAVRVAVENMNVNFDARNVLVAHQFVTSATHSGSEEISVGGTDNVDLASFGDFDYIALGHIHGAQNLSGGRARYCGTPLKYSFSEANQEKSITEVTIKEKGNVTVQTLRLKPLNDVKEIRGSYQEIMAKSFYEGTSLPTDYVHITLTDEEDVVNALTKLRTVYANLMKLDYDNSRTRQSQEIGVAKEDGSPSELFDAFYRLLNNVEMASEQKILTDKIIDSVWGGENETD